MSTSGLKRELPGWVAAVVIGVILVVLAIAGYRYFTKSEARAPSEYPPQAYQPPSYAQPAPTAPGGR